MRRETDAYKEFAAVTEQIVQVNEAICEARPAPPGAGAGSSPVPPGREKGGCGTRSRQRRPPS